MVLAIGGVGTFLSWRNAQNYYLVCGAEAATPERGSFLPTGTSAIEGPAWRPIALTPTTRCKTGALARFATEAELREAFLAQLLAEATARVTSADGTVIDEAEAQLEQAMLLTRSHPGKRDLVVQLQGDVEYWRGAARVTAAIEQLEQARKHFARAVERDARHGTDADKWGDYSQDLATQLRQGPLELRTAETDPQEPPKFTGTETSPAPDTSNASPDGSEAPANNEEEPTPDTPENPAAPSQDKPPATAPPPPPTGGVLL